MNSYVNPAITPRFDLHTPFEPVIYARLFLEVLGEEGVEPGRLLDGTGLSAADLADPANKMTVSQQIKIYANAAAASRHPAVGLLNGQRIMPHHHGVWGYAMQTAANLGQSIRIFNQYFDVVGPIARQFLQIDGNLARWISVDVLPTEPARTVGVEEMLSGNFNLCRILTDGRFRLTELRLDYPTPEGRGAYEDLFKCPVLFDSDSIEMRFDASLLNLKLKSADPESERICEERCQELLDRLGRGADIVDRVRRIIYENPCDRRDVDSVASTLCISSRTLRRHLKAADTTYRTVLNEVQEALAVDYLSGTDISIDEIAYLLGYSDTSNFRHAFKQWTGKTPSAFRVDARSAAES